MTQTRRRGRKARQGAPPAASAVWPGLPGGRYRPLTRSDEQQVHGTILDVLENIGMADPIPIVKERALQRGCFMNEHDRLCFPRGLVEDVIANTPRDIQFLGRDPKHDLEIGGDRVHTYGGGCCVLSPLRYGADNSEVCVESIKFGAPVRVVMAPQAGATAPAALAGSVVQSVAEALASLLMIDMVEPGFPVIVGAWPFVSDLRTGAFTGGSGEEAVVTAGAASGRW